MTLPTNIQRLVQIGLKMKVFVYLQGIAEILNQTFIEQVISVLRERSTATVCKARLNHSK